ILNVLYSIKGEHGQSIFIDNSFLNKDLRKPIDKYLQNKEIYSLSLSNAKDNYEIYKILSKTYSFERVLLAWNLKFRYKVYNYEKNIRVIDLTMNGQDIKELGIKEGKEIGLILEYMKKYKINLGLLDEENFLIDNMGEIKNAIKYKNT
ncbi:tRNA nucleotidyltransferase, partial [Clostridium botulinum]|nr:tRNA nucleotidyltransferase [Clostridium botulinum]